MFEFIFTAAIEKYKSKLATGHGALLSILNTVSFAMTDVYRDACADAETEKAARTNKNKNNFFMTDSFLIVIVFVLPTPSMHNNNGK